MIRKCPEKNSIAWKTLVQQVGDDTAWALWAYHGENYPTSLRSNTMIQEAIGYKPNMTERQVITMAKKLKRYNETNKTSHSFKKVSSRGDTSYDVSLNYSYWAKASMAKLVEAKAFKYTNGTEGAKSFINTNSDIYAQDGNQFFKDGELYPTFKDA